MAGKRSYDDGCASAHALELIGERWALLVVRELMLGPRRFTDLRHALPGISPNVLAQRLQELEGASIVVRLMLPAPVSAKVYALTDWGMELEPLVREIGRWAARSPSKPMGLPMSVNSVVLSFRTMFDGTAARGFKARLGFVLNGQPFSATISKGRLEILPGKAVDPDAVVTCDPDAIAQVVYGGRDLNAALRAGDIAIDGDKAVVAKLVTLFPLPERAPVTVSAD
jgi:DNA-binding HxlR family transcriptional regulator